MEWLYDLAVRRGVMTTQAVFNALRQATANEPFAGGQLGVIGDDPATDRRPRRCRLSATASSGTWRPTRAGARASPPTGLWAATATGPTPRGSTPRRGTS